MACPRPVAEPEQRNEVRLCGVCVCYTSYRVEDTTLIRSRGLPHAGYLFIFPMPSKSRWDITVPSWKMKKEKEGR